MIITVQTPAIIPQKAEPTDSIVKSDAVTKNVTMAASVYSLPLSACCKLLAMVPNNAIPAKAKIRA